MATRTIGLVVVTLAGLALGCVGSTSDGAGSSSESLVAKLPTLSPAEWMRAPAGCEGRLAGAVSLAAAEGADGIVVAVDHGGGALCADTVEAIADEIGEAGAPDTGIDELLAARFEGLGHAAAFSYARDERTKGDPSPQPSAPRRPGLASDVPIVGGGINLGDPSPQPSAPRRPGQESDSTGDGACTDQSEPTHGDPSPQPSAPRNASTPTGGDPSPQPSSPTAPAPTSPSSPDV